MTRSTTSDPKRILTNPFERYLTVWVGLCIAGGILLGKLAPGFAQTLDGMAIRVNGAPVVSIPIAICLFFMMYPIMVKIDFASVIQAGRERQARVADAVRQLGHQAVHDVRHRLVFPRLRLQDVHRRRTRWIS